MPEDLGELMGRAADEPVAPLDADAVWKRGSRQRLTRRAALALPIIVLVAVIGGLVVVSSDNDGGSGTEDSLFAGLTAEEQSLVDEYLRVLEAEGALAGFPDERAAVEYAWRVECFGAITPAELNALGAATTDLVGALSAEALVGSADMAGVATAGDLDAARSVTDGAVEAYEALVSALDEEVLAGDRSALTPEELQQLPVDVATARLESIETVRVASDGRQIDVGILADQYAQTSLAVLDVLEVAAGQSTDVDRVLGWRSHENLLRAEVSAASLSSNLVDLLDPSSRLTDETQRQPTMIEMAAAEDELLARWSESATGPLRSAFRNATATTEVRQLMQMVDQALLVIDQASDAFEPEPLEGTSAEAYDLARTAHLPAYGEVAEASVAEIVAATADSADPARDAAVAAACDATGDAILAVDPSNLDSGD